MYKTDLSVKIRDLTLKNPVMPASGAYDYFENNADVYPMSVLGAVMIKSVHRRERAGNAPPRIVETPSGMINAVGIPSIGIERFIKEQLSRYEDIGTKVILSLSGSYPDDYCESAKLVKNSPVISAVELNLSCPNVGSGLPFSADPELLKEVISLVRPEVNMPLFVKLSPTVTNIVDIVNAAQEAGADAAVIGNTYHAMAIDIEKGRPVLGNIAGGLSGPAIKPITLYLVYQACKGSTLPIIGCGGIYSASDAIEYIMAGAAAVQVGCGNFSNPYLMQQVIEGIDDFLFSRGYKSLDDIRAVAQDAERSGTCTGIIS